MKQISVLLLKRLLARKKGQGMLEYGFILLIIAIALVAALRTIGARLADFFYRLPL